MREPAKKLFEEGIRLFNAGRYFECHEVWEQVWKRANGAEKVFYQGLIQAAVAILHAERGNFRGAASIYSKACARLERLPETHMGIALADVRDGLKQFFASASSGKKLPARPRILCDDRT
jgi:predicted metal-dependent hydrolase